MHEDDAFFAATILPAHFEVRITTRQLAKCEKKFRLGEENLQTHSPVWRLFFFPLTDPFYICGQLFSLGE
jgi:hypothetical protein